MKTNVANRLTMLKQFVSGRCNPSSEDNYAWVWVHPTRDGRFDVSTVEISKELVDNDESVGEDQIRRTDLGVVEEISQVDELLKRHGMNPDDLDAPWHNNFPL
ncbi:hypothetical protein ACW9HR_03430 [Nocardia gipuzkoensis]